MGIGTKEIGEVKEETYEFVSKVRKILTYAMWIWTVLVAVLAVWNFFDRANMDIPFFYLVLLWGIPIGVVALIRYLLPSTSYSKTVASGRVIHVEKDPEGKTLSTILGILNFESELCPPFTANVLLGMMMSKPDTPIICFRWKQNGVVLYSFQGGKDKEAFIDYRDVENHPDHKGLNLAVLPFEPSVIQKIKANSGMDYTTIFCREEKDKPVLIYSGQFDNSFLQALADLQNFQG